MTGISYQTALCIDLCTVFFCAMIALRITNSLLHPAAVMLAAHAYIVTLRLSQLARGFKPMAYTFTWPIAQSEIVRGALASDAALIAIALGWVTVHYWGRRGQQHPPVEPRITLSRKRVLIFAAAAFAFSVMALAILGPDAERAMAADPSASTSGYLAAASEGLGWCFCLLIFYYGFRRLLVSAAAVSLLSLLMFSGEREVIIIPCVFLLFTWLIRRNRVGVPWAVVPAVVCIWLAWLPMKPIANALQTGASPSDAVTAGFNQAFTNFGTDDGSGIDFQFLDMISSTMTLVDVHQGYFYGASIAPLFVSPFPRELWPGKPQLNQYQQELDVPTRAMAKLNMTAGLVGESYADFGYFGVILIPFLMSVGFASAYKRLAGTSILTPGCLLYLLYLSTYMQLYRDGLASAVWFPFVHCAAIGWAAASHWIWPPRTQQATVPDNDPFASLSARYLPFSDSPTT